MGSRTRLYSHTGTTDPTNVGPANGGVLYSIAISQAGPTKAGSLIVRDGGPSGAIICQLDDAAKEVPVTQLKWAGVKIDGQLNLTLGHVNQKVSIEMLGEQLPSISSTDLGNTEE